MTSGNHRRTPLITLMIGAVGVIYGDIGTSPLYAFKICYSIGGFPVTQNTVLGILSLFIWSLLLIVTLKYIHIILKIDDEGEGGILVLSSLAKKLKVIKNVKVTMVLGMTGAALIFSDGIITPAISVLSAIEGLELISPYLSQHIILFSVIILSVLFYIQRSGSGMIGAFFGPVMIFWFICIGSLGFYHILQAPEALLAFNPYYALNFFMSYKLAAFLTMGGIVLVVTGSETIYADLGHFGWRPIQYSWNFFVLPMLLLNYLGQGSLLLTDPEAIANPFYHLVPEYAIYPLIALATCATIIASQAVISGVYSLCWQAIMLNYIPRFRIKHTSFYKMGQIYLPAINIILWVLTILAVLIFRKSEGLGVAYGLAIAGLMLITTFLFFMVAWRNWEWSWFKLTFVFLPISSLEFVFLITNIYKILEGAWFTLLIALSVLYIFKVWYQGNQALNDQKYIPNAKLKTFLKEYKTKQRTRIPGTAIFMSRFPNMVPTALVIHLNHNKFLHHKLLFVTISINDTPKVKPDWRYDVKKIMRETYVITANFGYMERPNIHGIMNWARDQDILKEEEEVSFFFSKGIPVTSRRGYLSGFGEHFYIFMAKNALSAYDFYRIPHYRVVELGVRYKI